MSEVKQKPQIQAKDLRISNRINRHFENGEPEEIECSIRDIFDCQRSATERDFKFSFSGIPLTEEWLLRMGVNSISHFTVGNTKFFDLSRKRQLSISCAGTPNCMVFIQDMENYDGKGCNPIVLHNYDYDGILYVHKVQNLLYELGTELTITGI